MASVSAIHALAGALASGFENNPLLVWWARYKIRKAGLSDQANIFWKSYWQTDLSSYDVVVVFGITHIMARLESKLQAELRPGSLVISNIFRFPNWKPVSVDGALFVYEK